MKVSASGCRPCVWLVVTGWPSISIHMCSSRIETSGGLETALLSNCCTAIASPPLHHPEFCRAHVWDQFPGMHRISSVFWRFKVAIQRVHARASAHLQVRELFPEGIEVLRLCDTISACRWRCAHLDSPVASIQLRPTVRQKLSLRDGPGGVGTAACCRCEVPE